MSSPAHPIAVSDQPWIPLRPGVSMRPLRFECESYALQLRIEPGTTIGRHRHTGAVHALGISGFREIVGTGEIVGPGDFVFEPPGNEDSWRCHGNAPCVTHIFVTGRVEYLDDAGKMVDYSDTNTARRAYLSWCEAQGVHPDTRIAA